MSIHLFWRPIVTDSEKRTGIAPICSEHPLDRDLVADCCPDPRIEAYDHGLAMYMAAVLNNALAEYFAESNDCEPKGHHCAHYVEGDSDCHRCGKTKWLPEGGI